jgi:hypothetical protein
MPNPLQVDPQFQRTVVVASKFDNRLKEFTERWEVDRCRQNPGQYVFCGYFMQQRCKRHGCVLSNAVRRSRLQRVAHHACAGT